MNELFTSSISDTIVALATAPGIGAISVIRLSGKEAITICNEVFKGKDLSLVETHTAHFGTIRDGNKIIDEVLVTVFIGPKSFTKENIVEVSCHGSPYITKEIIRVFLNHGARLAKPGEFTKRAFLNGQFDLAQAEAVADLIAADSEMSHKAALSQMRGGFSKEIKALRTELIHFASLIELELDFSEEDVEFANRDDLRALIEKLKVTIQKLLASFDLGNVIKNGVPTVIAGKPNAGKSTLLNALLNEDRAMVSDIAGTTRDVIEDEISIEGIAFRFIDTAGLRETDDRLEAMGIERTYQKMKEASLIIYLFDVNGTEYSVLGTELTELEALGVPVICVGNKIDRGTDLSVFGNLKNFVAISAANKIGIETLKDKLLQTVNLDSFKTGNTIVTNIRHYDALLQTRNALQAVLDGMDMQVTGDFLAMDIRQSLHYLGEIVGEITHEDLLDNIFSKFCIGK